MSQVRTFRLDKLVRDHIVADHEAIGGSVEYESLEGPRKLDALIDKTQEELDEFRQSRSLEELVDLREAVERLAIEIGHTITELHAAQYDKRRARGGFGLGHYVHTVTVPADSELGQYYASNPERFPEVKND